MKFVVVALWLLLGCLVLAEEHEALELNQPYSRSLEAGLMFTGRYVFAIPEEEVKKIASSRWYFFVDLEPEEENEWVSSFIKISIGKKGE
jgi:hypothetical protein